MQRTIPLPVDRNLEPFGLPSLNFGRSPAAGTDFTVTVDSAYPARLLAVYCRIVTDGTAGAREVVVQYLDADSNVWAVAGAPVTVAASTTEDYSFQHGLGQPDWPIDSTILVPLQSFLLAGSWKFRVHIVGVQVTDQLSRIRYVWQQYLSGT